MQTCKNCKYKAKNDAALNAFMCALAAPAAVPMMGPQGLAGVYAVRPPVTDTTAACRDYSPIALAVS